MFKLILKTELKNIFRDSMYLFFMIYPIILGVIGYFLIPYLESQVSQTSLAPEIVSMIFILMTGFIFGALTAFTLLDDKDDFVLLSLKVTPISVKTYVMFKLLISFVFGFIATIVIILTTNFLSGSSFWMILLIAILGALQAPGIALIVNSFSTNKVEGFVVMKMSGLILVLPVIAFFIQSWQEVFLIFAPGFWSARLIQMEL
ncbi:MAG: ABC transporter permease, partial [Tenericutes bacterium]|nr:ABC transporter permease [Mycoplasmatota bacterium]